ncbi:MAG: hypothetical protein FJ304_08710 [Planctomycetes bacterium]|nr:hypothetical protein [Planctomycetota bacterium]
MDANPWLRLPTDAPYVLLEDKETVDDFNNALNDRTHIHRLHTDTLLPEPFIGAKDAPVVLLSNNPGIGENEVRRQEPDFRTRMLSNLRHAETEWPFVYLNPAFDAWETWWRSKLRHLIDQCGQQTVARCILNVVYFPYPSQRYGHKRLKLLSTAQAYNFSLVREAVKREAVVVLLRSGKGNQKAWLKAVPELDGYTKFFLGKNPMQPSVSPRNCPNFYDCIVAKIAGSMNSKKNSEVR